MMIEKLTYKKTYLRKSNKSYGDEFLVTIKRDDDGRRIRFHYHDGMRNNSGIYDFIYALLLDASSYEDDPTVEAFNKMWEYDDPSIFKACKKQMERRDYFFSKEELKEINQELEEAGF